MTDRRYGLNKYGDSRLYGATDSAEVLLWEVAIDWDGDGYFESNESSHLKAITVDRGRKHLLQASGQGFENVGTGTATVTLWNDDGRYDGWNTSSPLYPNVGYGKDVRIRVRDLSGTASPYPLFRGRITNIAPSGYGQQAQVVLTVSDGLEYLRNYTARVPIQTGITISSAINLILADVKYPYDRTLDVSSESVSYWWASGNTSAMNEIEDLSFSALGYFFVNASGAARFVGRTSVSGAVASFAQYEILKDIGNPQPYEIRRNVVRVKVHPRTQASTGTVWQLVGSTPSIPTGESLTLWANYTYNNDPTPARNVVTPAVTTDWLVNSQSDGLGTNLSTSCTLTFYEYGDTAKIVITNNSGSLGYVTLLKIRGDAIYEQNVTDVTYPTDTGSVSDPRELLFDLKWQQDINIAVDYSNVLGPFYSSLHPMPVIKVENHYDRQFAIELFDIVEVDLDYLGLSGATYRVGGIEHQTDTAYENCQKVTSTFYLEPYIAGGVYMKWDTSSDWDTTTVFGW